MVQQQIQEMKEMAERVTALHKPKLVSNSVNGCGTSLLDYRPNGDGTYTTTRWITLFYLPLIPLSSLVVQPIQREAQIGREIFHYERISEGKLDFTRVFRTYLLALLAIVPLIFAFCRMDLVNRWVGSGPGFFVTLSTIIWFVFLLYKISNSDQAFRGKGA